MEVPNGTFCQSHSFYIKNLIKFSNEAVGPTWIREVSLKIIDKDGGTIFQDWQTYLPPGVQKQMLICLGPNQVPERLGPYKLIAIVNFDGKVVESYKEILFKIPKSNSPNPTPTAVTPAQDDKIKVLESRCSYLASENSKLMQSIKEWIRLFPEFESTLQSLYEKANDASPDCDSIILNNLPIDQVLFQGKIYLDKLERSNFSLNGQLNQFKSSILNQSSKKSVQSGKQKTITCVKGKVTKKVTGLNPKCPSGYSKK